ncbi:uncharacterized protein ASPGLDRAFT_147873 [Aspergillus glaucus CBS 516.65]|uniref:tetrahydrofolate synthase n=1 Tax=Aspergillus glaucus CBS 516.65 TaxID=1160497 RepID=A0A1L9VMI1_ASPGL|nr:hypothetical protein ASPGLDRAFT_147873 [Aspergillus glaucus CBS 516.65]OJJ85115.1 hypothetical protein ASPGLDRAFT_147873 [Aspergillus glaucus CBS 516.65]
MRKWLSRIGYTPTDLNSLNVVHVAGTKGKGSTCAFVNSILNRYHSSIGAPRKIGLYTSPHLIAVRERIQINSQPISEELFTKYFFEVWDALEESAVRDGLDPSILKPTYFRFLTLLSIHVFMREGVDVAVYEVGVGGENDSTNVFEKPAVTGITTLGIDHVNVLGDTIDSIAWHKSGIFKEGCPAFTVDQVPEAMEVLEQRAVERGAKGLGRVGVCPALLQQKVDIRPAEDFQRKNASLAIALAHTVLGKLGIETNPDQQNLPAEFVQGLESVVWRGRCEELRSRQQHWHLDGAHTEASLEVASLWFGKVSQKRHRDIPRVLVFNQQSKRRDAVSLLKTIHQTLHDHFKMSFQYALFCTNVTYKDNSYNPADLMDKNTDPDAIQNLSLQRELANIWKDLNPGTEVAALSSIEGAIEYIKNINGGVGESQVLVTGSLHLVGGAMAVLDDMKGE